MSYFKQNRYKISLTLLLLLAFGLYFWGAWNDGWSNAYYSAAVKSMLKSWRNFFYVSFDPAGFVSVDKPTLGLWIQCLFVRIFGYHGWTMILPQALASTTSIWLVYKMVGDRFGKTTGLLAGLFLATTPVFTAVSHTNNLDATLILSILFAAFFLLKGLDCGKPRWLMLSVLFVALGFNVKMVQAYLILPSIYLSWLLWGPGKASRRFGALVITTVLLLAVSLSWCIAVDLTPKDSRPYVGSSMTNSALDLAVGYNGIQRVFAGKEMGANEEAILSNSHSDGVPAGGQAPGVEIQQKPQNGISPVPGGQEEGSAAGSAGILRLFDSEMGTQGGWILPLAIFSLFALLIKPRDKSEFCREQRRHGFFWGFTFSLIFLYFSFGGVAHSYYVATLAPAAAAVSAIGVKRMWKLYNEEGWQKWLLTVSLAVTAAVQFILLQSYADWAGALIWALPAAGAALAAALAALLIKRASRPKPMGKATLSACLAVLLTAPLLWSMTPMLFGSSSILPFAGPELSQQYLEEQQGDETGGMAFENPQVVYIPKLEEYLKINNSGEKYLAAMPSAMLAAMPIIDTDLPVISVGGFSGNDKILSLEELKRLSCAGEIRFYLVAYGQNSELDDWVKANGREVPASEWMGSDNSTDAMMTVGLKLYDLQS